MKLKTILIVGGGTGGHISPGIALYEEFRAAGVDLFFLTGKKDARFSSLKDVAADDLLSYRAPAFTRNIIKLPFFILGFAAAVLKARLIIRKKGIAAVIGMGGYVSAPALIAAGIAGIPLYLCEQNTVPGKVTSFFARYAAAIFTTFESTREYMKKELHGRLVLVGNPIRKKVLGAPDRDSARKAFNLKHCKKVILAIGGSQGALTINELVLGLKAGYPGEFKDVGIIWSTGGLLYEKYKQAVQRTGDAGSLYLSPFIDEVGAAYMASDIAISRAGSGVMVELAAMGIPSILIPFPYAAMDHQDRNADEFVKAGAAVKIANADAVPEKVYPVLSELLGNPTRLARMSARAREAAKPDAAAAIVKSVMANLSDK
ncbi:MAG TPA: undecaprenyldiphospho-muramoylpentapeptide beta-N-acetylglucosaminyltransferase [Spirochaetota bacterium]|nr:undecaprenyldiphospho-muramoylpentapeptide beta-N-acetylglucosaminyltransferase [Spirochaetota bacterium]